MTVTLDTLLAASPYLNELATREAAWLGVTRGPDSALADVLGDIAAAGRDAATEEEISRALRIAKGRVALLAAFAEVDGGWSTAQSTAALADLADAALDAALEVLLRLAAARGDVVPGTTSA